MATALVLMASISASLLVSIERARAGSALGWPDWDSVARVTSRFSLDRLSDGSLRARVVYQSKQPKCVAPRSIHFGHELTPELYYFKFPDTIPTVVPDTQFKLPRVGPHTYELTLNGSTLIKDHPKDPKYEDKYIQRPVSEVSSVDFLTTIDPTPVTVNKDGKREVIKCLGVGAKGQKVYRF